MNRRTKKSRQSGQVDAARDPRLFENGDEWWDSIRRQLNMFTLRIEDVEIEEEEYPYEYQEVPLKLNDVMTIIDNELVALDTIVQSQLPQDPFTNDPQAEPQPTTTEQAAKKQSSSIVAQYKKSRTWIMSKNTHENGA